MAGGRQASRQTTACINCRQRKRRCDGKSPCSICSTRGIESAYSSSSDRRKRAAIIQRSSSIPPTAESGSKPKTPELESASMTGNPQFSDFSLKLNGNGELQYFGPTSSVPLNSLVDSEDGVVESIGELIRQAPDGQQNTITFPDLDTLKHHIDLFLEWQSSVILVLAGAQIDAVLRDYNPLKLSPKTMLLVAALLSLTYKFVPNGDQLSHQYFLLSRQLLTQIMFSRTTVEVVIAACILACQAYGSGSPNAAWTLNGISTTAGNILGLHVGADYEKWTSAGYMSQSSVETRVQAYWASVVIDRVLATCMGRHCLIHSTDFNTPPIRLQLPTSISKIPEYGTLNYEKNILVTFHYSVEFWKLNDKALSEIYDFRNGLSNMSGKGREFAAIMKRVSMTVEKHRLEISKWRENLPGEVKLSTVHPLPHLIMLEMAYHNCLILMHRPFIFVCGCTKLRRTTETSLSNAASSACKIHALEITKLSQIYQSHYSLRYSTFVMIHYLLNACTVLVVDCRSYDPHTPDHLEDPQMALQTCLNALQEISLTWQQATKALKFVHELMNNYDFRCKSCSQSARYDQTDVTSIPPSVSLDPMAGFDDLSMLFPYFCDDFPRFDLVFNEDE